MSSDTLQQAIELIRQKRMDEAQKLLEPLLTADPHNLPVWFWYVETISTDAKRLKALELCLKYNPDNAQVKQVLDNFRSRNPKPLSPPDLDVNVSQGNDKVIDNYWRIKRRPLLITMVIGSLAATISIFLTELQLSFNISEAGHLILYYTGWLVIPLGIVSHPVVPGIVYSLLSGRKETLTMRAGIFGGALTAILVSIVGIVSGWLIKFVFLVATISSMDTLRQLAPIIFLGRSSGNEIILGIVGLFMTSAYGAFGGMIGLSLNRGKELPAKLNQTNSLYKTGEKEKPGKTSYLILAGLSLLSALTITSLWLIIPFLTSSKAPGFTVYYLAIFIIGGQWLLVIPATLIVSFIYTRLWDRDQKHGIHIGIPLVFNLLAANGFLIILGMGSLFGSISDYAFSRNLVVTVKEETVRDSDSRVYSAYYDAILHVQNNTGKVITTGTHKMVFVIGAFDIGESGWGPHNFGAEWVDRTLPTGDSDIKISIPIDVQCGDENLGKPLSIQYSVPDHQFNSIPVSNNINKQLQQIVCN